MLLGRDAACMVHVASCVSSWVLVAADKRLKMQRLLMFAMPQGSQADASMASEASASRFERRCIYTE